MNNIDVIFTDLDKTLLLDNKTISDYTVEILTKCIQRKIMVIFATARSEKSCERFLAKFIPTAIISNGGALARKNDEVIYRAMLPKETANKLINICSKTPSVGYITVDTEDGYYVNHPIDKNDSSWMDYLHGIQYDFANCVFDRDIYKLSAEISNSHDAYKIAGLFPDVDILAYAGENWYRYAHKAATKWAAVKAVAAFFNIDIKNTAAFGDDYNDVEMIKNCGTGIAVENAIDSVKAVSDYICANNNEDGVARWIEKNILK